MGHYTTNISEQVLRQTIAHIDSRLADMGYSEECTYENALANCYHEMLVQYGRKLFLLQSRRFLLSEPAAVITYSKTE